MPLEVLVVVVVLEIGPVGYVGSRLPTVAACVGTPVQLPLIRMPVPLRVFLVGRPQRVGIAALVVQER